MPKDQTNLRKNAIALGGHALILLFACAAVEMTETVIGTEGPASASVYGKRALAVVAPLAAFWGFRYKPQKKHLISAFAGAALALSPQYKAEKLRPFTQVQNQAPISSAARPPFTHTV